MSTQEDREWWAHEDRISDDQDEATICHRCNLKGWIRDTTTKTADGVHPFIDCPECDGTGRIDPNDYEMEYEG